EGAGEVRLGGAGVAGQVEVGGGGGGAGRAGPGTAGLEGRVDVEPPARGIHHEHHLVPLAVVVAARHQGAAGAVPDVVGGVLEVPGAEVAAVGEDLVAVHRGGQVLVDDAAQACGVGLDPDDEGERVGVQDGGVRHGDVVVEAVEGEGLGDDAGGPGGAVEEGAVEAVPRGVEGGRAAPFIELPVAQRPAAGNRRRRGSRRRVGHGSGRGRGERVEGGVGGDGQVAGRVLGPDA